MHLRIALWLGVLATLWMPLLGLPLLGMPLAARATDGPVAHYDFDEGAGETLHDKSGQGNDGTIHGAQFVRNGHGYALSFDGLKDYVDCGKGATLDFRSAATVEAWLAPGSAPTGEVGIAGKGYTSYLLSLYNNGFCYWYVSAGGNNVRAQMMVGTWHHMVGTFDGKTLRLYLDGKLAAENASQAATVAAGGNLLLGRGPEGEAGFFHGLLDEVSVFDRALSAAEVQARFESGLDTLGLATPCKASPAVARIQAGGTTVRAAADGQLQIETGRGSYLLESRFSYPGDAIGWNALGAASDNAGGSEAAWRPQVRQQSGALEIEARGAQYRLQRRVTIKSGKVEVADRLTNVVKTDLGFIVRQRLIAPESFDDSFATGVADNPLIYLSGKHDSIGLIVEDNIARLRHQPALGIPANVAGVSIPNFTLRPGTSYTLRLGIHALPAGASYFDLVNRVRADWKSNFTLAGPFDWIDLSSPLFNDPAKLGAMLKRKGLRAIALSPWLDYDPGQFDHVWPRAEYKQRIQRAAVILRRVAPGIKCLGCIESDWVTIYPDKIPGGNKLPFATGPSMQKRLTAEQNKVIEQAGVPWHDSVKRDPDGNLTLELYMRGGVQQRDADGKFPVDLYFKTSKPQTALSVYPRPGNYQAKFMMQQMKFLLDEVGLDGIYMDDFNQAWGGSILSYNDWDGWTAEIDPRTGRIARKVVDCSLVGIPVRVGLIHHALSRGKVVVTNTYATSMEEQALPVNRFSETWSEVEPFGVPEGAEPVEMRLLTWGHLASPIGLGAKNAPRLEDTARWLTRCLIAYLRNGSVYYGYPSMADLPDSGPGSGDYGPLRHTFPLTPIGLHKGWIEARERTLTAISGDFHRTGRRAPIIHRFNLEGREVPADITPRREGDGWRVPVRIKDWAEIVVIE